VFGIDLLPALASVAAPTVQRLFDAAISSKPPEQPPRGTRADLERGGGHGDTKGVERQQIERLQRATCVTRIGSGGAVVRRAGRSASNRHAAVRCEA